MLCCVSVSSKPTLSGGEPLCVPVAATNEELLRAHTPEYLHRVVTGTLSEAEVRRIGFPWSPGMVERSRRSSGATLACLSGGGAGGWRRRQPGRRHASRFYRLWRGILYLQRQRRRRPRHAGRGPRPQRPRPGHRRPPGQRHRRHPARRPNRFHLLHPRRPQFPSPQGDQRSGRALARWHWRCRLPRGSGKRLEKRCAEPPRIW